VLAWHHDQAIDPGAADDDCLLVDGLGNVGGHRSLALAGDPPRDRARATFPEGDVMAGELGLAMLLTHVIPPSVSRVRELALRS
jgi:hypothetical protein